MEEESIELTQQIEALELEVLELEVFETEAIEMDDPIESVEPALGETAAKLDGNAWKEILETARPIEDSKIEEDAALSDLFGTTVGRSMLKYVNLSPEVPSAIGSEVGSIAANATDEMLTAIDALPDLSIPETDLQDWGVLATSMEALLEAPSVEDQLFRYLLACEKGARLSEIEVDLQLHRSQAVDAIRDLAKSHRLAQRDRHFFALK